VFMRRTINSRCGSFSELVTATSDPHYNCDCEARHSQPSRPQDR
jgi:hypothetical protein